MTPNEFNDLVEVGENSCLVAHTRNVELFADLDNPLRSSIDNYNSRYMKYCSHSSDSIEGETPEAVMAVTIEFQEEIEAYKGNPRFYSEFEIETYCDDDSSYVDSACFVASWYEPSVYVDGEGRRVAQNAFTQALYEAVADRYTGYRKSVSQDLMSAYLQGAIDFPTLGKLVYPVDT